MSRTVTLIIHRRTRQATTPRHDPWESAQSNLASHNDHGRGGAGRSEDQRFHLFPVLVYHEYMIHVWQDSTSEGPADCVFDLSLHPPLAEGLQSVALTAHHTSPNTAIVARGVTDLASSQG